MLRGLVAFGIATLAVLTPSASPADQAREALRARIEQRAGQAAAFVGVAFRTLDGRDDLVLNADTPFHAASTMKVAVLIDLYRQIDAGTLTLDDALPVVNTFRSIVDGSPYSLDPKDDSDHGAIYAAIGRSMPVRELAEAMITVSSNLATNLLIEKLGVARIRQSVAALHADGVEVRRGVEDRKAFEQGLINTTTARGLLVLFDAIAHGTAASDAACGEMIAMLRRQQFNEGIPAGLPADTPVAHKTGKITAHPPRRRHRLRQTALCRGHPRPRPRRRETERGIDRRHQPDDLRIRSEVIEQGTGNKEREQGTGNKEEGTKEEEESQERFVFYACSLFLFLVPCSLFLVPCSLLLVTCYSSPTPRPS